MNDALKRPGVAHPESAPPSSLVLGQLLEQAAASCARIQQASALALPIQELRDRLAGERLHLAVLGQFKRGKSTLLNALLGCALLPASVKPLTSVPTFVGFGQKPALRIRFQDTRPCLEFQEDDPERLAPVLFQYITEEANPRNRLGVAQAQVFYPSPLLAEGVVLIDTPGIGSTFRHNTDATLGFLPQCDAALFVVSADPPITEVEIEFLRQVQGQAQKLIFVLNKADYLSPEEQKEALKFLKAALAAHAGLDSEPLVFLVSARQALEGKRNQDAPGFARSGLGELEQYLKQELVLEKQALLVSAAASKADALLDSALLKANLWLQSLKISLDQLQQKAAQFDQDCTRFEAQRVAAQDRLAGDQGRARQILEEEVETLREEAKTHFVTLVQKAFSLGKTCEKEASELLASAMPAYFEPRFDSFSRQFARRVEEMLAVHQKAVDELVEATLRSAAELFHIPFQGVEPSAPFEITRQPYWVTRLESETFLAVHSELLDRVLPGRLRAARLKRRTEEAAQTLVLRNVENLRWALVQVIDQAFRRSAERLDERLREAIEATRGAIQEVLRKRTDRSREIAPEIERAEASVQELEGLQAALRSFRG